MHGEHRSGLTMKKSQKKEMLRKNLLKSVKETKREVYGFEISVQYGKRCVREYNKSSRKTIRDINILRERLKTQIDKHADELIEITKTRKNKDIEYINNKIKQLEKKISIKKVLLTRWIAKLKSNNDTIRLAGFNTTPLHRRDHLTSPPPPLVLVNDDSDTGSVIQNIFGKLENMKKKPNTKEVKRRIDKNSDVEQNENHGKIHTSNTTNENNMRRIITRSLSVAGVNNSGNILSEGPGCSTDPQVIHTARVNQENPGLQNNMHIVNIESNSGTVTQNIIENLGDRKQKSKTKEVRRKINNSSDVEQNENHSKIIPYYENKSGRMMTRSLSIPGVKNIENISSEEPWCSRDPEVMSTSCVNQEKVRQQKNTVKEPCKSIFL